ncbi:MAG: hypothetical protein U9R34_03505 [Nanoarchaeota archaeon]|nr:hypothetical protein [Nanoarchaeota archaeon]
MGWAINYEQNRDIILKKIKNIEKNADGYNLKISYNEKEKFILVMPSLANAEEIRFRLKEGRSMTIITINSEQNLDFIADNWKWLIDSPGLTIMFINPFSLIDDKWIIRPYIHNKISESGVLEKGLKTMFETVAPITEEEFLAKIKKE